MFGFGAKREQAGDPAGAAAVPPAAVPAPRTLESVVEEELPIQRHAVAMEGGMPSCLTLFDNFLLCYSLASQIKSVYRHGTPRDCMPKFEDFKFCMSVKGLSEERKEEVWVRRRAEWWARRRLGKSSEDVWDARQDVYSDPLEEKRRAAATAPADQAPEATA
ncbi:EMI1 family protein [Rhodotorula paludigena]|uniref:EMI1 family protein n=1 Tax=Rhodotorula paludigena TaxID=86838 RepID=UPI003175C314